jgi:hypothetical protein
MYLEKNHYNIIVQKNMYIFVEKAYVLSLGENIKHEPI